MKLTVFGPNISFKHGCTFEVHAAGCAHCNKRPLRGVAEQHTGDFANAIEVCDDVYDPESFDCKSGEYLYDFHFAPCVGLLPIRAE